MQRSIFLRWIIYNFDFFYNFKQRHYNISILSRSKFTYAKSESGPFGFARLRSAALVIAQPTGRGRQRRRWAASCLFCFRAWDSRDSRRVLVAARDVRGDGCYSDGDWPPWRACRRARPIAAAVSARIAAKSAAAAEESVWHR